MFIIIFLAELFATSHIITSILRRKVFALNTFLFCRLSDDHKKFSRYVSCRNYVYLGWIDYNRIYYISINFKSTSPATPSSFYNSFYGARVQLMSYDDLLANNFPDLNKFNVSYSAFSNTYFYDAANSADWTATLTATDGLGFAMRCWKNNLSSVPSLSGFALLII